MPGVIFLYYYEKARLNTSRIVGAAKPLNDPLKWENNEEIQILREYLRIPSSHPNVNYGNRIKIKLNYQFN